MRLLACFDPESPQPQPIRHLISSPSLLLLALRNLENRRQQRHVTRTDIVLEVLAIATCLLEVVQSRHPNLSKRKIPPDAALLRCFLQPAQVSLRHLVQQIWSSSFSHEDTRFLIRAVQEIRWNTSSGRRRCFNATWRLAPVQKGALEGTWIFRKDVHYVLRTPMRKSFGLGSVHRPEWRSLPYDVYSGNGASWILSRDNLLPIQANGVYNGSSALSVACMELRPVGALSARNAEGKWRHNLLLRHLGAWQIGSVFEAVRRRFNQRVYKYKSPDQIPVVDKPAPTLTDPERRISHMMRRMVPNIHAQGYRGMQIRNRDAEGGQAVYWYDSHYSDILASVADIESRLIARGLSLKRTRLEEPSPKELRDLREERP